MALPNKDEAEGKVDQIGGSIKEGLGKLTGDKQTETEGQADQASGDIQEGFGKAKRGISETVDKIGDAISDTGKQMNR